MNIEKKCDFYLSALLLALAVLIGAFGAHGLEDSLSPKSLATYKTGVTYHFYHALGFFLLAILKQILPGLQLRFSQVTMLLGITLFSGGCYLYAITGIKTFAMIVPLGGLAFVLSWITLLWSFKKV